MIKKTVIFICFMMCTVMLSGCQRADYAENQAYVVMFGIDMSADGKIELTAKYPKLSAGNAGGTGSGSEETSAYSVTNSKGDSFQRALNDLKVTVPREVNLSALSMIIISEDVVENVLLKEVCEQISANYRMYSSAYVAVCEGKASEFIRNQEPEIGSRLSQGIKALIENAERLGSIPDSRIADIKYRLNSVYSEPMIMLCCLENIDGEKKRNEYSGAIVTNEDGIKVRFSEKQTVIANVLMGEVRQFSYVFDDSAAFISVDKKPEITVTVKDGVKIELELELSAMRTAGNKSVYEYAEAIRADIVEIVGMCIEAGIEPFGFADRAAGRYATLNDWIDAEWEYELQHGICEVDIKMNELF